MPNFTVTLDYGTRENPTRTFIVENVATQRDARKRVLDIIGYDPGVPVEVRLIPVDKNKPTKYSNLGGSTD